MERSRSRARPPDDLRRKRIIVCCDGTWLDADNGVKNGQLLIPSNVTRLSRAIKAESSDRVPQVVFYQPGVGSMGGIFSRVVGGATGEGLAENIRDAYNFIANNYHMGDEIFLLGFSRGAFTARSVGGFIDSLGLLTKEGLPYLSEIFMDWEQKNNPNYRPKYPNLPFPNKPSLSDPMYQEELVRRRMTRLDIPIKAVGVFDTVGSLGIPRIPILEKLGLQRKAVKELAFFDTSLGNCIENAFQALALDEDRAAFQPTLWEKTRGNKTNLRQVWFPGVHSNIGGGYDDQEIANITMAWMVSQLEPFLDFDPYYIHEQYEANRKYYLETGQKPRPWSFGEIYNSVTGYYVLAGKSIRTPGQYVRMNPDTGEPTSKRLRNTREYVHPSARSRVELEGPGIQDKGTYEERALDGYTLVELEPGPDQKSPQFIWKSRSRRRNGEARKILPESPLWETERKLLRTSPKVYKYLLGDDDGPGR